MVIGLDGALRTPGGHRNMVPAGAIMPGSEPFLLFPVDFGITTDGVEHLEKPCRTESGDDATTWTVGAFRVGDRSIGCVG